MRTERQRLLNFAYRLLAPRADAEDAETPIEVWSECEAALRHLLHAVSPAEAAAYLLRDMFEFDYDEIARIIGKREGAARPWMLDGVILCIVPVGPEAAMERHNCS